MDARRQPTPHERPGEVTGAVRRRNSAEGASVELDPGRLGELCPGGILREVRGTLDARRAVDVAELRARGGDGVVRVPAAAAEERRRESALGQPRALATNAVARVAAGRSRVRRAREVGVMAERAPAGGLARAAKPRLLVALAGVRVRRTDERRDRKPAGPAPLQRR